MTLTPISSLESAGKNFSWTRGTSCLESGNQSFLGSVGRNDSNTHQFARIREKKFLMNSTYIMSRKWSRWFARTDGCKSHFGLLSGKTFDSHFLDTMYLEFMKTFFSPIRANWFVLESFRPPEPKNVSFPYSRHDVRRVHEKFFSPIRANWWVLESFRPPEPKNVWFPLSRHDVRRFYKKIFSSRFERTDMC